MYFEMEVAMDQKHGVKKWPALPDGVFAFQAGDVISVTVPEPVEYLVNFTKAHPPTDLVTTFMLLFSDRLVAAFRKAGVDNIQTFKALLKNPKTGETWDSYQVVNVLGQIACADLENSVYEDPDGMDYEFDELVIDVDKAKGALFFRLFENHASIIVHNTVLDHLYTDEGDPLFEGIDFTPIVSRHNVKK